MTTRVVQEYEDRNPNARVQVKVSGSVRAETLAELNQP